MTARLLPRLRRDVRGVTVIEFAMVAPVMMLLLMGLGDITYQAYLQAIVDGAMQKAGRDSALENNIANEAAMDATVEKAVREIAKNATFEPRRDSYTSFALIKPELIYDDNNNGVVDATDNNGRLDAGECFDDVNASGAWEAEPSRNSQGSADDVTVYTMKVTFPRMFPFAQLVGWTPNQTVTSKTILKNQPYKAQTVYTVQKVCLPA